MPDAKPIVPLTEPQREKAAANIKLAYSYAFFRAKTLKCLNEDDLVELAWIGLCRAAQVHDPLRGKFSTIARWRMKNEINSAIVRWHQQKRRPTGKLLRWSDTHSRWKLERGFDDVDVADWLECFQG